MGKSKKWNRRRKSKRFSMMLNKAEIEIILTPMQKKLGKIMRGEE